MSEILARTILDWLIQEGPYTYNNDNENLTIGVDGKLDCRSLAAFLIKDRWIIDIDD